MSRVGKAPVEIPSGVTVTVNGRHITVKGSKGEMEFTSPPEVKIEVQDNQAVFSPASNSKQARALWGLSRRHVANMVHGVSEGFTKELEIQGVGFRASADKEYVTLALGFSHEIKYAIPEDIEVKVEKQTQLTISGKDKRQVGQVASEIRSLRPPEPYKGKGVRGKDEYVRRKEGKKK